MKSKLLLPGIEDRSAKREPGIERFLKVEVKTARKIDVVSRAFGDTALTPLPDDVKYDDIVELEFENGQRRWKQWLRVEQLEELSERKISRDGEESFFIPHSWELKDAPRGIGTIALKALKIFGIDTPDKLAVKGAKKLAAGIAEKFESEIEKQGHPFGLYRIADPQKIDPKQIVSSRKPLVGMGPFLIFIHGTGSSSVGSFGNLAGTDEWTELEERYGDRILAFEHRTFSISPIENALDLANLIPVGAELHLVSHSRGGLVGELLCLAQAGESHPKFDELTEKFLENNADDAVLFEERTKQLNQLKDLWDLLLKKRISIKRFVRIACPALGTTLAGKRIDQLASGILNAIGYIPLIGQNPLIDVGYDWLKSLLLTLIKMKADPTGLPGIEAMVPDSPLIEFLNHSELSTEADLAVISGDIEVGNLKLSIPALLGNAFFWAKNDLVVNTKAMTFGIRRDPAGYDFFDQGSVVCHFNYFANRESRKKLGEWLLRPNEEPAGEFKLIVRSERAARGGNIESVTEWLEKEEPAAVFGKKYDLRVAVSHGDLRHAKFPVAVGHYDGDGMIGAEKYMDYLMNGRLAHRFSMQIYPGPIGTAEVVEAPCGSSFRGALVIGLGEMGDSNMDVVRQGVMTATLRYAMKVAENVEPKNTNGKSAGPYRSAAFTSLLIGTYGGNALKVKDSVTAILQGAIETNRILQEQGLWERVRIDEIEFIELYEDVAIQAIHAVYELMELKTNDFTDTVTVKIEPANLRAVGGGRYQRPVSDLDTYWYGRIQITAANGQDSDSAPALVPRLPKIFSRDPDLRVAHRSFIETLIEEAVKTPRKRAQLSEMIADLMTEGRSANWSSGSLEFQVMTDRARVEASMQATQRQLVDWMVEKSINTTQYDKDLSISLFELLIPNALKERSENVVLQLDRESAQYPWELMTERSQPDRPLATRIGLLRQFRTDDFRANPRPARGANALVMGDTAHSGLIKLDGAQQEAKEVADLLRKNGLYEVRELIEASGTDVINELFAREYQILHIAAHGNFDVEQPDHSGIVLDDGRYLTAKELVNLRTIPDLVFINCCHLGKLERLSIEHPNRLAASVAEELIKMGIKTVIAAGWAVDDGAAVTFAATFYDRMLKGDCFGQAVLAARRVTHEDHPDTNTWGAYQCYGNPNFRFNLRSTPTSRTSGYYSRREYRDALRSIASSLDTQNVKRNGWLRDQLMQIETSMPKELLLDGEVLSDFGEAWFVLGNFEEAIKFYDQAIHTADAKAALRSVERLANLQSRYATQLWQKNPNQPRTIAPASRKTKSTVSKNGHASIRKELDEAGRLFEWLLHLDETSDRCSLLGTVHKCLALIAGTKADRESKLRKAKELYMKGYALAKGESETKNFIFPAVNVVACGLFLPNRNREELIGILDDCRNALLEGMTLETNFWTLGVKTELNLLQHIVDGNLSKHQSEIIHQYQVVAKSGVGSSEAESVLWQMQFLISMLESEGRTKQEKASAKALAAIRAELVRLVDIAGE